MKEREKANSKKEAMASKFEELKNKGKLDVSKYFFNLYLAKITNAIWHIRRKT